MEKTMKVKRSVVEEWAYMAAEATGDFWKARLAAGYRPGDVCYIDRHIARGDALGAAQQRFHRNDTVLSAVCDALGITTYDAFMLARICNRYYSRASNATLADIDRIYNYFCGGSAIVGTGFDS